ncbi:MAG: helix-turn-helix transcriptional regulator [Pseudonocardiaceae bacterium]
MLDPLGLDVVAERVYRMLLRHPHFRVAEIAEHLDLNENVVQAAFDQLVDLSLLESSRERPGSLRPVSPLMGLNTLLVRSQEELAVRQRQLDQARAVVEALFAEYDAACLSSSGILGTLSGLDAVATRLTEMLYRGRGECLMLIGGMLQGGDPLVDCRLHHRPMLNRGATIKIIYQTSLLNRPFDLRYAKWLIEHGGQVRTVPLSAVPMVIVDREVALVLPDNPADEQVLEIRSKGVVATLAALFEFVWVSATPFGDPPQRDDGGLSSSERELLRLLSDGCTDQAAARALGMSLRTVRRMTSNLMKRLDARSRFQAGVRSVEQGWL